jgi:hypothetical protein
MEEGDIADSADDLEAEEAREGALITDTVLNMSG